MIPAISGNNNLKKGAVFQIKFSFITNACSNEWQGFPRIKVILYEIPKCFVLF